MSFQIIIFSLLTVLSALIGATVLFFIKLDHNKLCALISFSAGALFGAAVLVLIPESLQALDFIEMFLGITSGYILFWLLTKYYSHICPACSASHFDERTVKKFSEIVRALIVALSIHCFLDGLAISAQGLNDKSVFFAVLTHKFPEGLALSSLMFSAGYSKNKILTYVFIVESITLFGTISGNIILENQSSRILIGIVMSHIAGGFIFLASHAIMGEMLRNHTKSVIISFSVGLVLILLISKFIH